jgi:uncharacterized membrane-anchored protein
MHDVHVRACEECACHAHSYIGGVFEGNSKVRLELGASAGAKYFKFNKVRHVKVLVLFVLIKVLWKNTNANPCVKIRNLVFSNYFLV